ncbi:MAG: hypothetical protein NVS2B4_16800 [Ramlibacter sp.]
MHRSLPDRTSASAVTASPCAPLSAPGTSAVRLGNAKLLRPSNLDTAEAIDRRSEWPMRRVRGFLLSQPQWDSFAAR